MHSQPQQHSCRWSSIATDSFTLGFPKHLNFRMRQVGSLWLVQALVYATLREAASTCAKELANAETAAILACSSCTNSATGQS